MIYALFKAGGRGYPDAEMMRMTRTLLLMLVCSCAFVPARQARAAMLYVDTANAAASDSNPGTPSLPWKTIQQAATHAVAGDVVTIQPGEYNEYISPSVSGNSSSPIVFQGVRGSDGSWLTVIDPSTNISTGWVAAPEIGSGVYKYTNLTFEAQELSIGHKDVGYIYTLGAADFSGAVAGGSITNGGQFLTLASNAVVTNAQSGLAGMFWDGVEALYASTNASATYLRLRDGSNPNGLTIRVAGNWDDHVLSGAIVKPTWKFDGNSYIVLSNLLLRGSWASVHLEGSAHHVTIASNYLENGYCRLSISIGAHDVTVCNNEITMGYYGYPTPGAWVGTGTITNHSDTLYVLGKILMGTGSAMDNGLLLGECGNDNVICSNHIFGGVGNAIVLQSSATLTNTLIYGNRIENFASEGLFLSYGEVGTRVYDNGFANCNANMRFHAMDRSGEAYRLAYVYRNTLWNPLNLGDNIYIYWYGSPVVPGCFPAYWVYHNSFSGGRCGVYPSELGFPQGGMPNCCFLNNVFSDGYYFYSPSLGFWTNAAMVGVFDYNMIVPPLVTYPSSAAPAWFMSHNQTNSAAEWSYASVPDFRLHFGSKAIERAIDVTQPFTIRGTNYAALPATSEAKYGNAWDIGVVEFVGASNLHTN